MNRLYEKYLISKSSTLKEAISKIDKLSEKILFVIDNDLRLLGSVSEGDIRRYMLDLNSLNFDTSIMDVANLNTFSTNINKRPIHFSDFKIIPQINDNKVLQKLFFKETREIEVGSFTVSNSSPTFFIAEIGNNHNGSKSNAKKLIDICKESGVNAVKFQLRNMTDLYRGKSLNNIDNDLSVEYTIDTLQKFQLSEDDHIELKNYCDKIGIIYMCTPWDKKSVDFLEENFDLAAYKVASADFVNISLLERLSNTGKPLILSTGMTSESEIIKVTTLLNDWGVKYVLLHCNSTYPAAAADINLSYMKTLRNYNNLVGYSGHERGTSISLAAVALGASVLERHITLDRQMEGPDHIASLEPEELKYLVSEIKEVGSSLGFSNPRELSQGELINRENLGKSIVAAKVIKRGKAICDEDLRVVSPGIGLSPLKLKMLVGKIAKRDFEIDDYFFESDIEVKESIKRDFNFNLKWGIPVRYHDYSKFASLIKPDIYEFHLSYKDLELDFRRFIQKNENCSLVVHAPELFEGEHILDLTATDSNYRAKSIQNLQNVVDLTNDISLLFNCKNSVPIVVNVGGFSIDKNISQELKEEKLLLLEDSLSKIILRNTEILPQSMPPFPWHFGGQRFHNLFVSDEDIINFCEKYNSKICLDISHSYLSAKLLDIPFENFLRRTAKYSRHYHFADANKLNGEGIQIGDGDINFESVVKIVKEESPEASFIPEVWQGHKDRGSGFWQALDILESLSL